MQERRQKRLQMLEQKTDHWKNLMGKAALSEEMWIVVWIARSRHEMSAHIFHNHRYCICFSLVLFWVKYFKDQLKKMLNFFTIGI